MNAAVSRGSVRNATSGCMPGTAATAGRRSSITRPAGSMWSGRQIQPIVVVSFTATSTGRYAIAAPTMLCRTTSSKNHDEAITASTPGELARAAFSAVASSSRNAKLTAAAVTPCSS